MYTVSTFINSDAHFTHVETADGDSGGSNAGTTGHIVGPDLIPFD
jgi:hypothetical protein